MPQRQLFLQRWVRACVQGAQAVGRCIVGLGTVAQSLVAIIVLVAVLLEALHLAGISPLDVRQLLATIISAP